MQLGVAVGTALVAILGSNTEAAVLLPITDKQIKYVQATSGQALGEINPQTVLAKIWEG
jgi:hypothetical protein